MNKLSSNLDANFPIWYSEVSIDIDEERLSARLAGIKLLRDIADHNLIEGLVRIVSGIDRLPASQLVIDQLHESFKTTDSKFDPANSTREIQVLAGAALVDMMGEPDHLGNIAALSISTTSISGARTLDVPMDLPAIAEEALDRHSVATRQRPCLKEYAKAHTFVFGSSLEDISDEDAAKPVDTSHIIALIEETQSAFQAIDKRQRGTVKALAKYIQVQDEELQILWWLTGRHSISLNCDFGKIPNPAKPLVFGKELSEQTCVFPGLRSIRALMSRAGINEKSKLTIPGAINGADTQWLKKFESEISPSPLTQPLHFAISRSLEVDDDVSWISPWAVITGIKQAHKLQALTLGELFYREELLRRLL